MDIFFFNHYAFARKKAKGIVEGFSSNSLIGTPGLVASFLVSVFSAYLCWQQNQGSTNTFQRVIYCILAFLFSGIYLIYYFFMHFDRQQVSLGALQSTNSNVPDFIK
jgi:hypothetical protein